jgi:hypothetical protein
MKALAVAAMVVMIVMVVAVALLLLRRRRRRASLARGLNRSARHRLQVVNAGIDARVGSADGSVNCGGGGCVPFPKNRLVDLYVIICRRCRRRHHRRGCGDGRRQLLLLAPVGVPLQQTGRHELRWRGKGSLQLRLVRRWVSEVASGREVQIIVHSQLQLR